MTFVARAIVAAILLALASGPSAAPAAVPFRLACGPLGVTASGSPPLQHVQFARGAAVVETVDFEPEGNLVAVQCRAGVAGPGPAVLISNYTGGMHCCYTVSVYTTAPFRQVLAFDNNSVRWTFHRTPGGAEALVLNDGHFDYYGDLGHVWAPVVLPLVACYRTGRFVDCTREFPDVIAACEARYTADLDHDRELITPEDGDRPWQGAALGVYLCGLLRGQTSVDATARLMVKATGDPTLARRVAVWLRAHSAEARRWIASRPSLLRPAPGGNRPRLDSAAQAGGRI